MPDSPVKNKPLAKILKVNKATLVRKAHILTGKEMLEWWVARVQEVIDEDMSHAGPEKWSSYNMSMLNYRQKCKRLWEQNLKDCTID